MFWCINIMVMETGPGDETKDVSFTLAGSPEDPLRVRYRLPDRTDGEK